MKISYSIICIVIGMLCVLFSIPAISYADFLSDETLLSDTDTLPYNLRDRGTGLPLSMFGTYITKGQFYFYPFFEYYSDNNMEYSPDEFGHDLVRDYRGKYRASEGLIFFGYGITDWLAVEMEAAVISATLERAEGDTSGMPAKLKESGLGDVEGQLRWRWFKENGKRPELFQLF